MGLDETLEMKEGESITEYFARVMTVANKMRVNGEQMRDVTIVEKILPTLTKRFDYVVVSIEESKDIDLLTVDELQSSLIVHEQKFQRSNGEEQALKVTVDERNEEEDVAEAISEEEVEGEGDKHPRKPLWNAIVVISSDIYNMSVQHGRKRLTMLN